MSATPPPPDPVNLGLRVGTVQRERTLEVLRNAAADERLSFDELEGRVPRALGAVTRADLVAVLDDLLEPAGIAEIVGGEPAADEGPGYSWDDPLVLEPASSWQELFIGGPWRVPPFLEVHASVGGVRIDFSQATAASRIIDLLLQVNYWGTTTIIVPEGWGVDTTAYQVEVSSVETLGVRTRPTKGHPRVIVRGRTAGALKVRHPKPRDLRITERRLAKGTALPALDA